MENKLTSAGRKLRKIHTGPPSENPDLEQKVIALISKIRQGPVPVAISRQAIIVLALSIEPTFHGRKIKQLQWWVHRFCNRHRKILSDRAVTSTSAKIAYVMETEQVCAHTDPQTKEIECNKIKMK